MTTSTSAVAATASTYAPQPSVTPMAVTIQMVAALVKPVTPPLWWRMVPAPRNPTL